MNEGIGWGDIYI